MHLYCLVPPSRRPVPPPYQAAVQEPSLEVGAVGVDCEHFLGHHLGEVSLSRLPLPVFPATPRSLLKPVADLADEPTRADLARGQVEVAGDEASRVWGKLVERLVAAVVVVRVCVYVRW